MAVREPDYAGSIETFLYFIRIVVVSSSKEPSAVQSTAILQHTIACLQCNFGEQLSPVAVCSVLQCSEQLSAVPL